MLKIFREACSSSRVEIIRDTVEASEKLKGHGKVYYPELDGMPDWLEEGRRQRQERVLNLPTYNYQAPGGA